MKMLKKGQKGFTLIELLIVVAIIGILAAIAIPQFSAYRQRAYNGSAQSDLRNVKTAEESLLADAQAYGATEVKTLTLANLTGTAGAGEILAGPLGGATSTTAGAALGGTTAQGRIVGIGISISNGVSVRAATNATWVTYTLYAKHSSGTRAFGTEAENTGMFMVENPEWAGVAMTLLIPTPAAAPTVGAEFDPAGGTEGGGKPTTKWFIM